MGTVARLRAAMVGLQHGHMGSLDPAKPRGFLGTFRQLALEGEVEIVAVCEPHVAGALVGRGVHCFVEKSIARTAEEFLPVVDAARRSGAHVLVDYPWRHHPA